MLLPQRPYIPIGPFRDALAYPAASAVLRRAIPRRADQGRLAALADRLDESDNWQMRLSGGEQQRLAVARALLASRTGCSSTRRRRRSTRRARPSSTTPSRDAAGHDAGVDRPPLDAERLPQAPHRLDPPRRWRPRRWRRRRCLARRFRRQVRRARPAVRFRPIAVEADPARLRLCSANCGRQ